MLKCAQLEIESTTLFNCLVKMMARRGEQSQH